MSAVRFQLDPEFSAAGYRAIPAKLARVMTLWEHNPLPVFMDPDAPERAEWVEHWQQAIRSGAIVPTPALLCFDANPISPPFIHLESGRHRLAAFSRSAVTDIVVAVHPNNYELAHRMLFDPDSTAVVVE